MTKRYEKLKNTFQKAALLGEISGILGWDQNTYMPANASENRGEQIAEIASQMHALIANDEIGDIIDELKDNNTLDNFQKRNLELMEKSFVHASCIPQKLVAHHKKLSVRTEMAWREARKANDFNMVKPHLKDLLNIIREEAALKSEKLGLSKYESLLDQYDSGRKTAEIDEIFAELKKFIPEFIGRAKYVVKQDKISGHYPINKQNELLHHFMEKFGYDFKRGRLDKTSHPFCTGSGNDVRITTRYNESNYLESLLGVVHETGHALYEMNLPIDLRRTPLGESNGMSTHESQSLYVEKQICRHPAFVEYLYKVANDIFGKQSYSYEDLLSHIHQVKPSLIRVDADEVTYPAHVILRYEIERDLIEGKMELDSLPEVFNSKMKALLGITPDSDANGCMQDIHWHAGLWGYFPTYTLGAMTAAQLMAKTIKDIGDQSANFAKGNFAPAMAWVKDNVHQHANMYNSSELVRVATGEHLNSEYFINHLETRYGNKK